MNPSFDESVIFSLNMMSTEIINRKLSNFNIEQSRSFIDAKRHEYFKKFMKESDSDFRSDFKNRLKNSSPFYKYYNEIIINFSTSISSADDSPKNNYYYNPKLFQILHDRLYLIPFWSGIMIKGKKSIILS